MRLQSSLRKRSSFRNKQKRLVDLTYLSQSKLNWQWYEPPVNSAPVHFFLHTSLHGLQYLGQRKRHLCERIFWFAAFIAAMILSLVLIWQMWSAYTNMPIVTVFNPTEVTLDQIPFPAVTICSVNSIKKSKFEEYESEARQGLHGGLSNETLLRRFANILDVYHICYSAKSFTQKFYPIQFKKDELMYEMWNRRKEYIPALLDATGTLRNSSQLCEEMILFCLWLDGDSNCSELFTQIVTDYGYCCTFNMIPLQLLRTFVKDPNDDPERVKDWEDANLSYENLLYDKERHQNRKYPHRQLYAGRSAGLSFLVDPNLEEYFCTNTDSDGFVVGLNLPLDFPRMKDKGIAVRPATEVFVSVRPEITVSAESARKAHLNKRRCYFDGEKKLAHYTKYTASNCLDECITMKTLHRCNCTRYYMPRSGTADEPLCTPTEYGCPAEVREQMIQGGLDKECDKCWPACSEITYQMEVTSLQIRDKQIERLLKYSPQNISMSSSRAKNLTIIHIYYNMDSVFPRLRKEMSTTIDLISNAGGLLGLCMGFSMLSLLEIIYHATIRLLCNSYRERCEAENGENESLNENGMKSNKIGISEGITGFVSKILHRGSLERSLKDDSKIEEPVFTIRGSNNDGHNNSTLPAYYRTPFETDFQKAYVATTWIPPNFVGDAVYGNDNNATIVVTEQERRGNTGFYYR